MSIDPESKKILATLITALESAPAEYRALFGGMLFAAGISSAGGDYGDSCAKASAGVLGVYTTLFPRDGEAHAGASLSTTLLACCEQTGVDAEGLLEELLKFARETKAQALVSRDPKEAN